MLGNQCLSYKYFCRFITLPLLYPYIYIYLFNVIIIHFSTGQCLNNECYYIHQLTPMPCKLILQLLRSNHNTVIHWKIKKYYLYQLYKTSHLLFNWPPRWTHIVTTQHMHSITTAIIECTLMGRFDIIKVPEPHNWINRKSQTHCLQVVYHTWYVLIVCGRSELRWTVVCATCELIKVHGHGYLLIRRVRVNRF